MTTDYGIAVEGALAQGNIPEAARLAEAALDAGLNDPLFYNLAAWRCETNGDYPGAEKLLQHASPSPRRSIYIDRACKLETKAGSRR